MCVFISTTANLPLPSAPASVVLIQRDGSSFTRSLLSSQFLTPRSGLFVFVGL